MDGSRILPLTDLEAGVTEVIRLRRDGETREAIVLKREDDSVAVWVNECQHIPDIPLDRGDGATMRGADLVCERHGAHYDTNSGRCTSGPCEGAVLPSVAVTVEDGQVVLTDEQYSLVGRGPIDRDSDLSSGGAVGF